MFTNASIAVVSGGHSSNEGASNIDDGLTIDLAVFSNVTLSEDREWVWIGSAARWTDVYAELQTHGLTVAGGRVGHVGAGGYVLGGGFSWHANQHGWSCDSVTDFEVVTPALEILWVNATSHAELFWALKGSLGAFGIVTGMRMKTIPDLGFYGGGVAYEEDALAAVLAALKIMANDAETDLATAGYLSFGFLAKYQEWSRVAYLINTANSSTSPSMDNFLMIPQIHQNLRYMTPKESADEIAASNPLGFRRSKFTFTILPTMEAMKGIYGHVKAFARDMQFEDDELLGVTYQPLTVPHLQKQDNIFAGMLTADYGPLLLVSVDLWWKDASKDAFYEKEFRGLCEDGFMYGLGWMRVLHAWFYPNYAASWQQPLEAWRLGRETFDRMTAIREKYDSGDVWRGLVPGIWHI